MIKWTTPTLECTIPEGLEYDYVLLTLQQGDTKIEKRVGATEIVDNKFSVFLSQEETSQFQLYVPVEAQINVMHGAIRIATNIIKLSIDRNLHEEYIDPDIPTTLEITENGTYGVSQYLEVNVNVQGGVTPTGTLDISTNGTHDVTNYASANVDVPKSFTDVLETTMTDGSFETYGGYQAYNTFNDVWYTELVNHIGIEDNTLCVEIDGNTIFANGEVRWGDYEQTTVELPLQENTYGIYNIVSTSSHTGLATDGVIQELVGKDIKLKIANEKYIRDNYTVVDVKDYAFAQIKWFPNLQSKDVTPTEDGEMIHADVGYDGLMGVWVKPIPPEYIIPAGTLSLTENGVVNAKDYEFVDVNVQSQPIVDTLWESANGEEYGDLDLTVNQIRERYDVIQFVGVKGTSSFNYEQVSANTFTSSASSSKKRISVVGSSKSTTQAPLQVDGLCIEVDVVNDTVNFNVLTHYRIENADNSNASFVYEPSGVIRLKRIVGRKY